MNLLERIWEFLGLFFSGLIGGFERAMTSVFGSSNERYVKRLQAKVDAIGSLESKYQDMSNDELKEQTEKFRARLHAGETHEDIMVEAFAVCREAGKRFLNMRHYDVQMVGGMVLHSGAIAEMVTGEGKTLVATLPAYLNAIDRKGVHVVTVNDYLARRDMEWMAPLYIGLGLTVGAIQSDMPTDERQKAYECDITYGTNNEFGFDYLRDNMRPAAKGDGNYARQMQQSQGRLNFAIVDEVDNILIDEARTPLIISGPAHENIRKYAEADRVARQLKRNEHFEVNEKDHSVNLTDPGVREAERLAGVESFYTAGNMEWPHLIDNALKAHFLYKRDVNYVVKEGRVVIVDEFTGRLMEGRQWSDGLHQAAEAKEGVKIKEETQTLATITLQNFFKLYGKLCGMTGTAMTEAAEFWKIYGLDVVRIPTNRELERIGYPDVIYCTEEEKYNAIAKEIEELNKWDAVTVNKEQQVGTLVKETDSQVTFQARGKNQQETIDRAKVTEIRRKGRPVLVGTTSIEKSEVLAGMLERRGIRHEVLNAKHHKREAEIVAQAGRIGAVTIATNMAGRGTDIILGGNPETMAWAVLQDKYETRLDVPQEEWDSLVKEIDDRESMSESGKIVKELGGLHVIGTERHEARRIDLQLRGRCGRQGDPGSSRFYLSLRDDLMRIFAGEWVEKILKSWGGWEEGDAIESAMVTRRIEAAQKKVEERNFEVRKNLLEYDEVMDEQRKRVYGYRQAILEGTNCKQLIVEMVEEQVQENLDTILQPMYGAEAFSAWASNQLATPLEARDFRGLDFPSANERAKEDAERAAETQVLDAIDENLPEEEDSRDWNWAALAKMANSRWGLNLRDRDLVKVGRDHVAELLIERAREAIGKVDMSEGAAFLDDEFSHRTACAWVHHKFGLDIKPEDIKDLEPAQVIELVRDRAIGAYQEKESEYPVMAGMYRFSTRSSGGQPRVDRQALVSWVQQRFGVDLSVDDLKSKQREEIYQLLLDLSHSHQKQAGELLEEAENRLDKLFAGSQDSSVPAGEASGNGSIASLADWCEQTLNINMTPDEISELQRDELHEKLCAGIESHFRPEIRRMERQLVLQLVDSAWKDHLLAMDHLRSAVGLVGYAQVDPKVEYKREGRKLFDQMWTSMGQRVTDLIFKMEQLDEGFVGSTWVETAAVHESAPSTSEIAQQQDAAIQSSQGEQQIETIRNRNDRVGRNDPCPCGSGKKYKNCCLKARAS
ncbi:MAG: preprotein translocase subunit SecA [Planctomycetaceae bacterium]|nr:preprotein translocase subunit SecA [Planctomycetaceae bacterium]